MSQYLSYLFSSGYFIVAAVCLGLFGGLWLLWYLLRLSPKAKPEIKSELKNKGCLIFWLFLAVLIPVFWLILAMVDAKDKYEWNIIVQQREVEIAKIAPICQNPNKGEVSSNQKNITRVLVVQKGGMYGDDGATFGWKFDYSLAGNSAFPYQAAENLGDADGIFCLTIDYSSMYKCVDTLNVNSQPKYAQDVAVSIKLISWPEGQLIRSWERTDVSQECYSSVSIRKLIKLIQGPGE